MSVLYTYNLKRPCGFMRPFCKFCPNTFQVQNYSPVSCAIQPPPTVCVRRDVPPCGHPELVVPNGFVVTVYLNGGAHTNVGDGTNPGDYGYGRTIGPLMTELTIMGYGGIPHLQEACSGPVVWQDMPGVQGLDANVGCGYRVDTRYDGPQPWPSMNPDNPWLPDGKMTGPSFLIGYAPKAMLFWFDTGLDDHFATAYDAYGSVNDYSSLNYMQPIVFNHFCGHTGMAPGHETYIEAYPF